MAMLQTAPRRAWEETKGVFHNPFFWGIEIVGGAIVTAVVLNFAPFGLTGFLLSLYQVLAPVSYIVGIFALVLVARLVRAPYEQRNEARALLAGRAEVVVTNSYPVLHRETSVRPYGDYILVSGLNITNHADSEIDCSLSLEIEINGEIAIRQPIESREIANAPVSLPEGNRGNRQLTEQIKIAKDSRAIGFAAFSMDLLSSSETFDEGMQAIDRLTLIVDDAVNNTQLIEHEVWPWQWRELLGTEFTGHQK